MMKILCLVFLSVIISVSSNPLGQLVQTCNVCPPASYSNTPQPSNTSPYSQAATVQVPATYPGPLGETLNQIILNRILTNPSLQKFTDPNTKLYNQNGDEVTRQGVNTPNVINNYFIVPPEFFNINETISKDEEVIISKEDTAVTKPRRRKLKKKNKKVMPSSAEDEEEVTKRKVSKKQKQNKTENLKRNRKVIVNKNESDEMIDELDASQETVAVEDSERGNNKKKYRRRKKKQEIVTTPPPIEESGEDFQELEDPVVENRREKVKKSRQPETKHKNKIIDENSNEIIPEVSKPKFEKVKIFGDIKKESDDMNIPQKKKIKNKHLKKSSDKILGNIEIPTDISNKVTPENRPTRDSKKNAAQKEPEQKITKSPKKEPSPSIAPFPDDVLKNFYPQMGNYYNPNSNYPYNFDQYNQYLNPVRNSNANIGKKKTKNTNKKTNKGNSNTHTIEIKLKPRKKENVTETVTTEKPKEEHEVVVSIETEQSSESIEQVTLIPMEIPQKVSPVAKDDAVSSSKESFETFSKLEDLHEFIAVELGTEDEVPSISNNGIINDYYPIFDEDVYYNPYAEKIDILDDRYLYNTEDSEKKLDRYEDARYSKDTNGKRSHTDAKTNKADKIDPAFKKSEYKEYFDDLEEQHDVLKSNADIRRVKVPSKNTMVKPENVETVFAGSKVVKYGAVSDEDVHIDENISPGDGSTSYVVAKSLGRPEDYNYW